MKKIMLIIYLISPISLFAAHFTIYEDIKIQLPEKFKGSVPNGTKLRVLSMVLIFYKTVKYLGFMRFSSMQKRLNLAAFGADPLNYYSKPSANIISMMQFIATLVTSVPAMVPVGLLMLQLCKGLLGRVFVLTV